jgi:hypothetical protein
MALKPVAQLFHHLAAGGPGLAGMGWLIKAMRGKR